MVIGPYAVSLLAPAEQSNLDQSHVADLVDLQTPSEDPREGYACRQNKHGMDNGELSFFDDADQSKYH